MKKKRNTQESATETLLEESVDTLRYGLKQIRREIELIATGKAKDNGHDAGSRIAFLTVRVGTIADSVRKVEAARAKRVSAITKSQVLAYLRQLDVAERAQLIREMQALDRGGSVLG